MNNSEIIKALECCCENNNCNGCPLENLEYSSQCASELAIKSLDLINSQKAEIRNYKQIAENQQKISIVRYHDIKELEARNKALRTDRNRLLKQNKKLDSENLELRLKLLRLKAGDPQ